MQKCKLNTHQTAVFDMTKKWLPSTYYLFNNYAKENNQIYILKNKKGGS